jgi:hypothetical protein
MSVSTNDDMIKLFDYASKNAEKIPCNGIGYYSKWLSKTGAELWIHVNKSDEIIGVNPFYDGQSNFSIGIINKVKTNNEKYNDFVCLLYAWVNPNDDLDGGDTQVIFDCVNIAAVGKIEIPCKKIIKLSAFAHELSVFPNEENYKFEQEKQYGKIRLASKSFFPTGLFSPNECNDVKENETEYESFEMIPEAVFTGIILDYKEYKNEITQNNFFWIKTETYGGIIDVLADPTLIEKELKKNGIISGVFYMYGKIIDPKCDLSTKN